jgi:hypothetical protein
MKTRGDRVGAVVQRIHWPVLQQMSRQIRIVAVSSKPGATHAPLPHGRFGTSLRGLSQLASRSDSGCRFDRRAD